MPRRSRPPVRFELDEGLELLSVLVLLARPRRVRLPYAEKVRRRFSPFSGHPAVSALRGLLSRGVPEPLIAEVCLLLPDAGSLPTPELSEFFSRAREFSQASSFPAFFRSVREERAAFAALAKAEAARGQRPGDVSRYLRVPFPGACRMLLAPLLPRGFAVNVSRGGVERRVRCGSRGRGGLTFEFGEFDCCPAHELTHTVVAPLIAGSRGAFEAMPGAPPKACRDSSSWSGCYEEHLVRAITLRALKAGGAEKDYRAILRRWGRRGYPYLEWFCARLEDFERSPSSVDFAAFHPGLAAAFLLEFKP